MSAKASTTSRSKRKKSSTVLITGATGFLGKHLVTALRDPNVVGDAAACSIKALVRTPTLHLERNGIDTIVGDVCRAEDCRAAIDGVDEVYHLAGRVSRSAHDSGELYRLHVDGTRRVLEAAAEAGVRRVVVVSTSGTVAVSRTAEVSTEDAPYRTDVVRGWPYYLSKIYQEQTALKMAEELDLDVVIVNPSLLLGPGDERGSSTGEVERVVRGRLPILPKGGGIAFVDARDAATGCIAAMKQGKSRERYLLVAENVTLEDFMGRVARLAQVTTPRAIVDPRVMKFAGRVLGGVFRSLDATPPLDLESVEMAEHFWYCSAEKAAAELGWTARDPQQTLLDTVCDLQRRHSLT